MPISVKVEQTQRGRVYTLDKMTEDRGQKREVRDRTSDDREDRKEVRELKSGGGGQKREVR